MKKLLFMATMLLSFGTVKAQISDVRQKGSILYVYDENNKQLSNMRIDNSDEYLGMGSSFFVVKKNGSYIYTYDYNSKQIASMKIGSSDEFKSAGGNSFNIKKNRFFIYTYDKNCKQLSSRRE
jgi:hypothetical protein